MTGEETRLLMGETAFERVGARLKDMAPGIHPLLVSQEGGITDGGAPIAKEDAKPDIAWMSTDILMTKAVFPFVETVLASNSLDWVQSGAAGFDHQIFKSVAGVTSRFCNSNAHSIPIAEFVIASTMAELQPVAERRAAQEESKWQRLPFRTIFGTKWLVIGLGNIGQEIGKRAEALGAEVTGVRRTAKPTDGASKVITPKEMESVLPEMDVIALACPLDETTHHTVNEKFLKRLKKDAILVNIGRGGLVDEAALLKSLDEGKPAKALLDVFETEPLPEESPFWAHPSVRVTAHCAAWSPVSEEENDKLFLENLSRFLKGEPLLQEVPIDQIKTA